MRFIILVLGLLISSCSENKIIKNYETSLSVYDKDLIDHFPKLSLSDLISYDSHYSINGGEENYNGFHLITKLSKSKIADIEKMGKIIPFLDSCQHIINFDPILYSEANILLLQCKDSVDVTPIPNFSFCIKKYPKDFFKNLNLSILDTNPGKYLNDEYLTKKDVGLPEKWRHGFSKGIAINKEEDIGIYWIEIW